MKNVLPLLLSALLLSSLSTAAGTAKPPLVLATLQDNTATLIKQAAALLAAGHPAQAGTLYLGAGDAAAAAHQLDIAAAAYQKAADAFHLANDPGNEATADERLADVYLKQAGVTVPAAGKPATPAPTPAAQAPVRPAPQKAPAQPAVPKAGADGAISGPPIINPEFGARMPRKCKPVTHVPSEAEAAALAQCKIENGGEPGAFDPMIYLWQNLRVQMGKSRPYAYNADSHSTSIDTEAKVYPIRVTGDQLSCTGKPTCMTRHADNAEGTCYKTTFGDWQCYFSQVFGVTESNVELPAPKTY